MNNYFYFTFGSSGQVFSGGWIKIRAKTLMEAQEKFHTRYGVKAWKDEDPWSRILAYCSHYNQEDFDTLEMFQTDNLGAKCHEVIE